MTAGVIAKLVDTPAVQALVGENQGETKYKVYPGICPQPESHPYLIVRRTGKSPVQCKGGSSGLTPHTFEVIAYHKSYNSLDAMESAVEDALNGVSGVYGGVTFKNIHLVNAFDAEYIMQYNLHARVFEFQAMVG